MEGQGRIVPAICRVLRDVSNLQNGWPHPRCQCALRYIQKDFAGIPVMSDRIQQQDLACGRAHEAVYPQDLPLANREADIGKRGVAGKALSRRT